MERCTIHTHRLRGGLFASSLRLTLSNAHKLTPNVKPQLPIATSQQTAQYTRNLEYTTLHGVLYSSYTCIRHFVNTSGYISLIRRYQRITPYRSRQWAKCCHTRGAEINKCRSILSSKTSTLTMDFRVCTCRWPDASGHAQSITCM